MKTKLLILSTLLLNTSLFGQVLLNDDFSGTSVDTSLWTVGLPESDASVTEGNGYVALENAGRITTQMSMPPSYEIYGSFLMANNPYDNMKVVLRSNGTTYNNSRESAGIAFQFNVENDTGETYNNLRIFSIGNPAGDFTTPAVTASLTLNTWHTFRITDDGLNLNLYYDGSSTPSVSAQSTFSVGNLVTIYNREGAGAGSYISANGITEIDSLEIIQVPEPSIGAIIFLGLLPLIGLQKRK
jgi:hypothetical protein